MADAKPTEACFVGRFILRQRRKRVLYELSRPEKRRNCLANITAAGNDRLDPRRVQELPHPVTLDELLLRLERHGCHAGTEVCVIKGDPAPDGRWLPLHEAFCKVWAFPPYVLIAQEQCLAVTAGESGCVSPWRALLSWITETACRIFAVRQAVFHSNVQKL